MNTALARITRLVSNRKSYAAALTPTILALGTMVANWISSGVLDATELRIAGGGLAVAAATGVVTWLTSAGVAEVEVLPGATPDGMREPDTWEEPEEPEPAPDPPTLPPTI